jgi:hypothetical protein
LLQFALHTKLSFLIWVNDRLRIFQTKYTYVSNGFNLVLAFIGLNMLRSACMLGHLRRFGSRQDSELDQLVIAQHIAINNRKPNLYDTTWIFD